ncbi:sulfate ABC transporter, inner membrane subunit CysT [Segniliparus rotundus DSM 44985]|uniref:Sulfate transport system permease protein CysT n=1 Tax=Segniliparus rotundus (strain ATCC BAA-972 / CDC 1076 / CIP 108378 / DSM 44985 / JCM 13578) TaxID=640132 RepID=D6ZE42_SEGRD|nr:sulfate ABC transporter permease subunit CysT [Segniliparus rotundus]ADG97322.1 sulfate ABC transporter, inner membrane subunit CysT [Segniliparus rotundus DSM 44985]
MSRAKGGALVSAVRRASPASALGSGVALLWLSLIVLLPLAAIAAKAFDGGAGGFWRAVSNPDALAALEITVWVSFVVALVDVVFGALIAWVLVRDDFPGKAWVNAIIDLPFALPTIVASIVLLSLYGPQSPIGLTIAATQPALVLALAFVTLPFVVRQVQPVLLELDQDVEEAAASLGAGNAAILTKVIFPSLAPAVFTGAGLAFSRAIGEFGSLVLLGGNIPHKTQVVSQYIQQQIEIDQPQNAAAVSSVLLLIAFFVLLALRLAGSKLAWREEQR